MRVRSSRRRGSGGLRWWCALFGALLAIGMSAGCGDSDPGENSAGSSSRDDNVDGDAGQTREGLVLERGGITAGGSPAMSNRFELVGAITVMPQQEQVSTDSARFTLTGGI